MASDKTDSSGNTGNGDNSRFLEQLVKLTAAVQQLAQSSQTAERDEDALVRQRVDFGYQALGTLMGRSRARGFNVRVIDARWDSRGKVLELFDLPDAAAWVELRGGAITELLEIDRQYDGDTAAAGTQQSKRRQRRDRTPDGRVQPAELTPDDRIDSLLVLRVRQGPPIAIGPRVEPSQNSKYA